MNTNTQVVTVDFHGQQMIAIKNGDQINVAMKPICESIGIDWKSQYNRIKRHPVMSKGMVVMTTPSDGGDQATATLPIKMLNGWLFGIDAGRVKPESRDKLIEYQAECFDVLAAYFMQGEAINPRMQYSVNPGDKLTKEQADTLRQMLTEAAEKAHPGDTKKQGVMIRAGWSKLKAHFKVSYRDIPQIEFTEAVSIMARHAIDGEFIGKEDAAVDAKNEPKKIAPPVISDYLQTHINQAAIKALSDTKFALSFVLLENGQLMPQVFSHHKDAQTFVPAGIVREIRDRTFGFFPDDMIPDLISAISHRLRVAA